LNYLLFPTFAEIIYDESMVNPSAIEKVLLCSGNVYYDLKPKEPS